MNLKTHLTNLSVGVSALAICVGTPAMAGTYGGFNSTTTNSSGYNKTITIDAGQSAIGGNSYQTDSYGAYAPIDGGTGGTALDGYAGAFFERGFVTGPTGNLAVDLNVAAATTSAAFGQIQVAAFASVSDSNWTGAQAHVFNTGVLVEANAPGVASVGIDNAGAITVEATAFAQVTGGAYATAAIYRGINEVTNGGDNEIAGLNNSGTILIAANASAHADGGSWSQDWYSYQNYANQNATLTAYAYATINEGILQSTGGYNPASSISNSGTITVDAGAFAQANNVGVYNAVHAYYTAYSFAEVGSRAFAAVWNGIDQYADGGTSASASLTNAAGGVINVNAGAHARATTAYASAWAGGPYPYSSGAWDYARATAVAGASASAYVGQGISQEAWADQNATVTLNNSGAINIGAYANATAYGMHAWAQGAAYYSANEHAFAGAHAQAGISTGVYQYASSYSDSAGALPASVSLNNSGTLNVHAHASAYAEDYFARADSHTYGWVGDAYANVLAGAYADANIYAGIYQDAYADGSAVDANASISNNSGGVISIVAAATALAAFGSGYAVAGNNNTYNAQAGAKVAASAYAYDRYGIYQTAYAYYNNASVNLTNSGNITIGAGARAIDFVNGAEAYAYGYNSAYANAVAGAHGYAAVGAGIYQEAYQYYNSSAEATVGLTNDVGATLNIGANASGYAVYVGANASASSYGYANAVAGAAVDMVAHVSEGIYQYAESYNNYAAASLNNSGAINIEALAHATGYLEFANASAQANNWYYATAYAGAAAGVSANASIRYGIEQVVYASSGDASITNNAGGVINIAASAYAHGTAAQAHAKAVAGDPYSVAIANASAGAFANASVEYGIYQDAYDGDYTLRADLTNSGTIHIAAEAQALSLNAHASATAQTPYNSSYAYAFAGAKAVAAIGTGIYQYASGSTALDASGSTALVDLNNSGVIGIQAVAKATATSPWAYARGNYREAVAGAFATATVGVGIYQSDSSWSYNGGVSLENSGTIAIKAEADAAVYGVPSADTGFFGGNTKVGAFAYAQVDTGIYQYAFNDESGNAVASLNNAAHGVIDIRAVANATGVFASASANIEGNGETGGGIFQDAYSYYGNATAGLTNDGVIQVVGEANANAKSYSLGAQAYVDVYAGIGQQAEQHWDNGATAYASLVNSPTGTIEVAAIANAAATGFQGYADASANVDYGIWQYASGSNAAVNIQNDGTIGVHASANAVSLAVGGRYATAKATALVTDGIWQEVYGYNASATLTNTGHIDIGALAKAAGKTAYAYAYAGSEGAVYQSIDWADTGTLTFNNSGHFLAHATATASGAEGYASATAHGVKQVLHAASEYANFTNSGTFAVVANATVKAPYGDATANAVGLEVYGDLNIAFNNTGSGTFLVAANAAGPNAYAYAEGVHVSASGTASGSGYALGGTFNNAGHLRVSAAANGSGYGTDYASATGIHLVSGSNNVTMNNTGTIDVSAQVNGGVAHANAIILGNNGYNSSSSDVFTLNNLGGAIIARASVDNGATWQRGTAIDASEAPNAVAINLQAKDGRNGLIYGNIVLPDYINDVASTITVSNGETKFDGVINPGASSTEGTGDLTIANGGTLYFVNQPYASVSHSGEANQNTWYDGPAGANVANFTVANGGTLALQLPTSISGNPDGYPVITANTVTLGANSKLEVRPASWNGLYGNSYTFEDIIVSNDLTGTFGSVTTDTNTPLLAFTANYANNDGNNVSLTMSRVHFGAVTGLTDNQSSVGGGLEGGYSSSLTGPAGALYAALFTQDKPTYENSLNQLSGEQYAGYLQSLNSLTGRFNGLISSVTDCPDYKASIDPTCQRTGKTRVWAQFNQGRTVKKDDAFSGLGGYGANQTFLAFGADYKVSDPSVLGLTAAYVRDDLNFNRFGGRIKSDGFQIGAYATYDVGRYYAKAVFNYSALTAHSTRSVNILNMQDVPQNGVPGAVTPTQSGNITGFLASNPKADVISAYGEVGYRFGYAKLGITPYVALEYTDAKLKAFTETGVTAADLAVTDSSQSRATGVLGLRIGGTMGKVTPELNAGWRHQFGSKYATVNASFADLPGSAYSVQSAYEKADTAFVDLGLSAVLGKNVVGKIGYQGRFNGDNNSNSGTATLIVSFGGFGK